MITIEIKNRWNNHVIFSHTCEGNTVKITVKKAYESGANLGDANLVGANLGDANLVGADLRGANLVGADLRGADFRGANLVGADLRGANLRGADFRGANLVGANLTPIKNDMFILLLAAIGEIPALKLTLKEGRIDGSAYEGECACLCGTIEKTKDSNIRQRVYDLRDSYRPIERFFLGIEKGNTPENNQFAKLAFDWIEEFESLINPYLKLKK